MLNNPIVSSDPSGHKEANEVDGGIPCYPGELVCQLAKDPNNKNQKPKKNIVTDILELGTFPTFTTDTSSVSGPTFVDHAIAGDYYYLSRLFIPTHIGFRLQGEISLSIEGIGGWSPAGTFGVNYVHNFVSGETDSNADLTFEPYSGGILSGGSVTGGPLVGWGSSKVEDVTSGKSEVFGGTIAAGPAISTSVVVPVTSSGDKLYIDPIYGIVPTTLYVGGGAGVGYAGAGIGRSTTVIP